MFKSQWNVRYFKVCKKLEKQESWTWTSAWSLLNYLDKIYKAVNVKHPLWYFVFRFRECDWPSTKVSTLGCLKITSTFSTSVVNGERKCSTPFERFTSTVFGSTWNLCKPWVSCPRYLPFTGFFTNIHSPWKTQFFSTFCKYRCKFTPCSLKGSRRFLRWWTSLSEIVVNETPQYSHLYHVSFSVWKAPLCCFKLAADFNTFPHILQRQRRVFFECCSIMWRWRLHEFKNTNGHKLQI